MTVSLMVVIIAVLVLVIAAVTAAVRIRSGNKRSKKLTERCTKETVGVITKKYIPSESYNTEMCITAEYTVGGITYKVDEYIGQYKEEHPEAERKRDRVQYKYYIQGKVGDSVAVMYDPENPKKAYLKENKGTLALHLKRH